ncbi:MAG: DUF2911 domain-containing protein [Chitinophagales bacterium]|nr:DUF2911 domain-containing protein [Chitinophagales bacterium]MCZ2392579.1 DUF2911 domain-containing protein [Chitinophagales bacterium]
MKKKRIIYSMLFAIALGFGSHAQAQGLKVPVPSPQQKISQGFAISEIQIDYSRPSVKGRVIFGDLVPYGKVWRTGANSSTTISFGEDVKINGHDVKAGTYAIYTVPGPTEWKLSLYSDLKLGGNVNSYDTQNEVISIQLPVKKLADKIETFTIQINNLTDVSANISLAWENTSVSFNVNAEIDEDVMKSIEKAMKDNRPYGQAASYYLNNGKDLNQAYDWIQKAIDQAPYAFWHILSKAKIEKGLKKHEQAIETANLAKVKAAEAQSPDYVKMSETLIEECKAEIQKLPAKPIINTPKKKK